MQHEFRNVGRLAAWTLAWMASLALASFGPGLLWSENMPAITWGAVALNLAVGAVWIFVHAQYLRGVDDLQRKILMDGIAVALGVGLVVGFGYAVAAQSDLLAVDSEIAFLSVLMGLTYIVAVAAGTVRYR